VGKSATSSGQSRLHGPDRYAERPGYLVYGKVGDVMEHNGLSLSCGKSSQGNDQGHVVGGEVDGWDGGLQLVLKTDVALDPSPTTVVDVNRDAVEPRLRMSSLRKAEPCATARTNASWTTSSAVGSSPHTTKS